MVHAATQRWVVALIAVWGGAALMIGVLVAVLLWRGAPYSKPQPAAVKPKDRTFELVRFVSDAITRQRRERGGEAFLYLADRSNVGDVVLLIQPTILQITGPSEMLVVAGGNVIRIEGMETSGLIDGRRLENVEWFLISKTVAYRTTEGATNTTFAMQPIHPEIMERARTIADERGNRENAGNSET